MPPRKGQKNHFLLNRFLAIKRNQDVQLACALVKDRIRSESEKNKAARVKGTASRIKFSLVFVTEYYDNQ